VGTQVRLTDREHVSPVMLQLVRRDERPETVSSKRSRPKVTVSTKFAALAAAVPDHRLIKQIQWFLVAFRRLDRGNAD